MHARGLVVAERTCVACVACHTSTMRHQPAQLVEQGQGGIFKGLVQSVVQDECMACSSSECGLLLAS
jgi:hypothetical protein